MRTLSLPRGGIPNQRNRRNRAAFSLLEILTVLTIMSVLSTVMIMSFNSSESTKLTTAGNTIADALIWARQNSITKNAYTAIVVKTVPRGAYSSYCLLQLQPNADGSYGNWTAVTPWRNLPAGIFFYYNTQVTDNFLNSSDTVPVSLPTSFPYQGQPINLTQTTTFHVYQPDGSLISNQEFRLRLMEGFANPITGSVTCKQLNGSGQPVNRYDVMILRDTGQINIDRS